MYTSRYLEQTILKLSRSFPIILLTGARQVGKTTLLRHLSSQSSRSVYHYVSLDEFEIRRLAKDDPGLFLQQYPAPLIIDEIQYAPQLLSYLKSAVDREKRMGRYWLTGSQHFPLMKGISESLAGRVGIVKLLGLSWSEERGVPFLEKPWSPLRPNGNYEQLPTILSIFSRIVRGSFPRLLHRQAPPLDSFYGSYVQTYIDRDLRDLLKISSLASFEKFIRLCAARTATVLNLSDLARDSSISVNTAKEWLSLLESSGQIFLLRPFYKNIGKRLIKAPKLYFLDTGLVCYLTGWREAGATAKGAFAGQLFETFVIGEILKSYYHRGLEPRVFYYRSKEKIEVDLLIEKNGLLLPVEIKLASLIQLSDIKGIEHLQKKGVLLGKGAIIAPVRQAYALNRNLLVVSPIEIS